MFVEELTKIRESESYADELQKKAKLDAKQALAEARTQADRIVEEAENRAGEIYDALISEGQTESDEQYALFLEKKRAECAAMIERARKNESRAVASIAERIVRLSGNS